jgi:hypothetical protein
MENHSKKERAAKVIRMWTHDEQRAAQLLHRPGFYVRHVPGGAVAPANPGLALAGFGPLVAPMRRKAQLIALLVGWSLATGAQWDIAQAFAWGRMFASYVRETTVIKAVELTFAPGNMCAVCKAVNAAKQQENAAQTPGGKADAKVILFTQASSRYIFDVEERPAWAFCDKQPGDSPEFSPPLEPPRAAA